MYWPDRLRSWGRWLAVTLFAIGAAAGTLLKPFGWNWPWLVAALLGVAVVMTVPGKILTGRLESAAKRRDDHRIALRAGALEGARRRVRDFTDPTELGVHRAALPEGYRANARTPGYVPRDVHTELADLLVPGSFVLILGDSTAGKTRLAYEATRANPRLRNHVLIVPERLALEAAIHEMTRHRKAILWLDDLETYLSRDELTPTAISRMLSGARHNRLIVATLRLQELDRLENIGDKDRHAGENQRKVLARATEIRIGKAFTRQELERAKELADDPYIADALVHASEYGLAEYLAAGPALLARWLNGKGAGNHTRGAALVDAAIDCRRAGYLGPLPKHLLERLHHEYIQGPRSRPETVDEAWAWATALWRDANSLLDPTDANREHFTVFDYLVDHVQRNLTPDDHVPESVIRVAMEYAQRTDLDNIADRARGQGRYSIAHSAYTRSLAQQTKIHGAEHPATLTVRNMVALTLRSLGRLDEAEREHSAVLEVRTRNLGDEDPATLMSRNNRAVVLRLLGRLDDAEREHQAVLDARIRILGAEDAETLRSRNDLALVLGARGRLKEAEREHRTVLEARIRVLGDEDPATLMSRNNRAAVLADLGRLDEAEREYRSLLDVQIRVLGAEHPDTLVSRNNVATVLKDLKRFEEAEREHRIERDISARVLGEENPDTLISRNNLALVWRLMGRLDEAEQEHRAVLEIQVRQLGSDHPESLISRNNLAIVLRELGRLAEAEREHRTVVDTQTRLLGAEHPTTLTFRSNLAVVLRRLGRLEEAEREHRTVFEARLRTLGADHPDTVASRSHLDGNP